MDMEGPEVWTEYIDEVSDVWDDRNVSLVNDLFGHIYNAVCQVTLEDTVS